MVNFSRSVLKIYTGQKKFTRAAPVAPVTNIRYGSQEKNTTLFGNFSQHGGGVFPIPKTFVNLPSIFLYAKFILRC